MNHNTFFISLFLIFIGSTAYAQNNWDWLDEPVRHYIGAATATCEDNTSGVRIPFGKLYIPFVYQPPYEAYYKLNDISGSREHRTIPLETDFRLQCRAFLWHGCAILYKMTKGQGSPKNSLWQALMGPFFNQYNGAFGDSPEGYLDYYVKNHRFSNGHCYGAPDNQMEEYQRDYKDEHVPHPNRVLPVTPEALKDFLPNGLQPKTIEPYAQPHSDRVFDRIRRNWDNYDWELQWRITKVVISVGGLVLLTAILAGVTGGLSLGLTAASYALLASVLLNILIDHGEDMPQASLDPSIEYIIQDNDDDSFQLKFKDVNGDWKVMKHPEASDPNLNLEEKVRAIKVQKSSPADYSISHDE